MQASVLGQLTLQSDETSLTPTAPKLRRVLALLLLHANQVVPVSGFFRELWEDEPPPSALTTLQTYILHLRRLLDSLPFESLGRTAREILVTRPGGYMFRVRPGELDLHTYNKFTAEGRRALAEGDNRTAADAFCAALALWRGPALVDVQGGRLLELEALRLEQSRLATVEQHIEASLRLGRHLDVLSDLTALVAEHQLNENLHAQLMLALHRGGRRQEALMVFHRLRSSLIEELGLEPSRRVHRLQEAILADDPALEVSPAGVRTPLLSAEPR